MCMMSVMFAQTPPKFAACIPNGTYSVDDYILSQRVGKRPQPDVKPEYEGGVAAIKAFFQSRPLKLEDAPAGDFTVALGFLVNCKGVTGNVQVLSQNELENNPLVHTLMEWIPQMPKPWMPGKYKGRFIDCWQVMRIEVKNGRVENVSIK